MNHKIALFIAVSSLYQKGIRGVFFRKTGAAMRFT